MSGTFGGAYYAPLFFHLLPYLEQGNTWNQAEFLDYNGQVQYNPNSVPHLATTIDVGVIWPTWDSVNKSGNPLSWLRGTLIPAYRCPSDPTLGSGISGAYEERKCYDWCAGDSSYAGNFLVFGKFTYDPKTNLPVFPAPTTKNYDTVWDGNARIPRSFPDGSSNTVMFAEKYARCGTGVNGTWWMRGIFHGQQGKPNVNDSQDSYPGDGLSAVFAGGSGGWLSGPNSKFQVQPRSPISTNSNENKCDWRLATTAHAAMNAAMGDGSVRSLSPSMSPSVWYAFCTPNGGEVVTDDTQ